MTRLGRFLDSVFYIPEAEGYSNLLNMDSMIKITIKKVLDRIYRGDSQLKSILKEGYTIEQVIAAIKTNKCISNLGTTYLEQTISGIIRDLIKDNELQPAQMNLYREIFGLRSLSDAEMQDEMISARYGVPVDQVRARRMAAKRMRKGQRG